MGVTARINAPMDEGLKTAGDGVLAEAGLSPTKLVRLAREKLTSGSGSLNQLLKELQSNSVKVNARQSEGSKTNNRPVRGERIFTEGIMRLEISQMVAEHVSAHNDWKAPHEEAIANRLEERGILREEARRSCCSTATSCSTTSA